MSVKDLSSCNIGFIGAGQMAQAIVKGLVASDKVNGVQITLSDRNGIAFKDYKKYSVNYIRSNLEVAEKSDILFISVKPHIVATVLNQCISKLVKGKILISVAAGVTIDQLCSLSGNEVDVLRLMPNTPCLVQEGTGVLTRGPNVTDEQVVFVKSLLSSSFPVLEEIPDTLCDAATALAGCGPAYLFVLAEAMADGAVKQGLPRDLANRLAHQTIRGAAVLLQESGDHPGVLKDRVCSAGGATIHGVYALEQGGLRKTVMNAIEEACRRSKALSES